AQLPPLFLADRVGVPVVVRGVHRVPGPRRPGITSMQCCYGVASCPAGRKRPGAPGPLAGVTHAVGRRHQCCLPGPAVRGAPPPTSGSAGWCLCPCPVLLPVCPVLVAVVRAAARSGGGGGGPAAGQGMRRGGALPAMARPGGRGGEDGRAWRGPPGGRGRGAG